MLTVITASFIPNSTVHALITKHLYKSLDDQDYELIKLFARFKFDFKQTDPFGHSMYDYIQGTNDARLIYTCLMSPLVPDAQSIGIVPIKSSTKTLFFASKKPPSDEQRLLIETLSECFSGLLSTLEFPAEKSAENSASQAAADLQPPTSTSSATSTTRFFKEENKEAKDHLCQEIIDTLQSSFSEIQIYAEYNVPTWCKEITLQKLSNRNMRQLEELREKIVTWTEKTILRIINKLNENNDPSTGDIIIAKAAPKTNSVLYEGLLPYFETLMLKVNELCSLLLPFNAEGRIGLSVINQADKINPDDYSKFSRLLVNLNISRNPNQPGIRFLCNPDYNCSVIKIKPLIAELKISDSLRRIGVYRLAHTGKGKVVLALGPFIDKGFHDDRHGDKLFVGHSMDFSEAVIKRVEGLWEAERESRIGFVPKLLLK